MIVVSKEIKGFNISLNSLLNEDNCKAISESLVALLGGVFLLFCNNDDWVGVG